MVTNPSRTCSDASTIENSRSIFKKQRYPDAVIALFITRDSAAVWFVVRYLVQVSENLSFIAVLASIKWTILTSTRHIDLACSTRFWDIRGSRALLESCSKGKKVLTGIWMMMIMIEASEHPWALTVLSTMRCTDFSTKCFDTENCFSALCSW